MTEKRTTLTYGLCKAIIKWDSVTTRGEYFITHTTKGTALGKYTIPTTSWTRLLFGAKASCHAVESRIKQATNS